VPAEVVAKATSAAGAIVAYTVSVTDNSDPSPTLICTPLSGSVFAIGDTLVTCTATDAAGNAATDDFSVHVKGAAEQLADLGDAVNGVGPGTSLRDKVNDAQAALGRTDVPRTCSILRAFINQVKPQSRKSIPPVTAVSLVADATRIRAVLGC
jgi:hypothetical protein